MSDNVVHYPSYIKIVIDKNEKVARFLGSAAQQSVKTATIYGVGLTRFAHFLSELKHPYTLDEIIESLAATASKESTAATAVKLNVYDLLEDFVYYLMRTRKLAPRSIRLYTNAVRSYFAYYEIDIVPARFKRRVKIPKILRYDEEPIDVKDIRDILNSCSNKRLKAYLLVLGSGGMRAIEAVAIRFRDIRYSPRPTKIHIRPEFSKTRVGRDIYISDEATKYLKEWIDFRFRDRNRKDTINPTKKDDDLVFQHVNNKEVSMDHIYRTISLDFNQALDTLKMNQRKEGMSRRKITLNSFRRFVYSTISTIDMAYAEWFLGHAKSPYWQKKEAERREIYTTKCMNYLTFLDYSTLEARDRSIEARLTQKDIEIQELKERVQAIQDMGTKAYRESWADLQLRRAIKAIRKIKGPKAPIMRNDFDIVHLDPEVKKMYPALFPKKKKGKK